VPTAAIALGSNLPDSNLGSREANLRTAISSIANLGQILAVSTFHDTAPVGYLDQPRFLNAALLLSTELQPLALLHSLLAIEHSFGRDRANAPAKGPRIIDLDLILYDNLTLETPELTLPHPAMRDRLFVLAPLAEIAPDLIDPVTGLTIASLLAQLR
jgi:2-amino-4-hydroxy-6-hydroxymethyldihydropteridine diphosphokinase